MPSNRMVREPEQKKPLAILRGSVTESAANTYTERSVPTPVSAAYFQAMRLHRIQWDLSTPEGIAATETVIDAHFSTRSRTTIGAINEDGIIATTGVLRVLSATDQALHIDASFGPAVVDFGEQGILVTDAEMWVAVRGTNQTTAKVAHIVLYYTLETLQADEYIAALTVLGSQL